MSLVMTTYEGVRSQFYVVKVMPTYKFVTVELCEWHNV